VIPDAKDRRILAPAKGDEALSRLVRRLRSGGDVVVQELPGHGAHRSELGCTHAIVHSAGQWVVKKLAQSQRA
jgi:ATP phosphoribosyltransferase regulatory subunit